MSTKVTSLAVASLALMATPLVGRGAETLLDNENSESVPIVAVFDGGQQLPLTDVSQFLIYGLDDAVITTVAGESRVQLPGRINIPAESREEVRVPFKLTRNASGDSEQDDFIGSLTCAPRNATSNAFLESHAVTVQLTEADLAAASRGVISKFVFLPELQQGEKWAGHYGTLTMGSVTPQQRANVLRNISQKGLLLAELQLTKDDGGEDVEQAATSR